MAKMRCAAVMLAMLLFSGCGASAGKDLNMEELVSALLEDISYEDKLSQLDTEMVTNYITLESEVEAVMYMGSGATAESVAVFEAPDSETAQAQKANVEDFLQDQKDAFRAYKPEEAKRIEEAVLITEGNYVILSVSGDSEQAQEIIAQAFD